MRVSSKLHESSSAGSAASIAARWGSSHGGSLSAPPSAVQRLVHRESRCRGRHLEQDAAGLPEVDGLEVGAGRVPR